jgi:hypothetical protein
LNHYYWFCVTDSKPGSMIQLCIDRFKYYDILIEISPLGDLWTLAGSPM